MINNGNNLDLIKNDVLNQNLPKFYYKRIENKNGAYFNEWLPIQIEVRRKLYLRSVRFNHTTNKYDSTDPNKSKTFNFLSNLKIEISNLSTQKKFTPDKLIISNLNVSCTNLGNIMPISIFGVYRDALVFNFTGSKIYHDIDILIDTVLVPENDFQISR